jgi:predicted transcriptional regulator
MKLKHPVTLAIEPEVCAALDQIARSEERSRSWLANRLLREGVAARLAIDQEALDDQAPK